MDSRSRYDSSFGGEHAPINDYDDYSMEYQELPDQPRHASFPHPQSDDYFDGVDPYSSPTPLPRGSIRVERRAMAFGVREGSSTEDGGTFRYSNNPNPDTYDRLVSKRNVSYANQASCSLSENLVPVSTLPDWCRNVFKFGVFNAMQSQCFDTAVNTDSNMVISAPTGAGKTVLFELSVIRLLQYENNVSQTMSKCVYMAPTKAICSERSRDWSAKFNHLGVKCCELTGDTMKSGRSAWKEAKDCAIIITTPEKWDSLTRNWDDSSDFLQHIKLFMVDEVHTVGEPTRGSCLEVVVSRMMQRGNHVRFVLVSATAPNIEDLKDWLSSCSSGEPTGMFKFGDEYRPCQLQRYVYGYTRPPGHNDFQFMKTLDYKLFPVIQQHSTGKPVLVFCPTRKSVMATASHLMEICQKMMAGNEDLPWSPPRGLGNKFSEPQLQEFANLGLGVHHAGLSLDERHTVEELFTQRKLSVIVATSTLAVGVNFPAHIVIIKGVTQWTGTGWAEYSNQDIMQMLGRAGRPQFDREGIAIVMCDKNLESKYKLLATGGSQLESTLHYNLTEHINSEIGLNTIKNVASARQWLRKTFLFRRIQKNPAHYKLDLPQAASWEERVDALITKSISVLKETQLVKHKENDSLALTEFGEIMSYYIRQSTMKLFIQFAHESSTACLRSVLNTISGAEEFKDLHMRGGERQVYNKLNENQSIRFPVKKAENSADKAFLLIQAILGGVPLMSPEYKSPNSQPHMEALNVMRHAPRMITALVDTALVTKNGSVIMNGMSLMRCLNGKAWEDRPAVLKQIDGIGEKSYKVLAENGITTIKLLSAQNPNRIEMLLNRRPPFGSDIISSSRTLPSYSIIVEELTSTTNKAANTVDVELLVTVSAECTSAKDNHAPKGFDARVTSILTITSDNQFIDFRRINTRRLLESIDFSVKAPLTKPSQEVVIIVSSDKFAGITERYDFKPALPAITYPTPNTRPPKPIEVEEAREDVLDLTNSDPPEESTFKPTKKVKEKPTAAAEKNISKLSKTRLPNGNYACHHKCKDKTACRHMCCRDGLPKPPPSPKSVKPKRTTYTTLSSPTNSQQKTKTTVEKQKQRLDYLHNKANDGVSRVKRDSLIRTRGTQPSAKATSRYMDSLLSSPLKASTLEESSSSDQDLPEPSVIRAKKQASLNSGSTSYDDSDMDQWAANLPSELLEFDVEAPALSTQKNQSDTGSRSVVSTIIKNNKRPMFKGNEPVEPNSKRPRTEPSSSVDELPLIHDTPIRKRPPTEILPTPHSPPSKSVEQPKPLFRPSSSVGQSSPGTYNPSENKAKVPPREDAFEDFMDYIFEGVKIITGGASEHANTMVKVQNSPELSPVNQLPPEGEHASQISPLKAVEQPIKVAQEGCNTSGSSGYDPMTDLNSWLDENGL
ncbi:P-loop nucleoside triphosphate hydrolase, putative [Rhizoctonia solani AG-3 Rhs1AP]|uniref:DNA 3'-5' helicase n=2 Tax=Rhizoctonia solani AG-3 TaxID=1086053 RepID=A0A074SFB7_9AGAM|nr:P-loop nucleoside triphosphate hydrolase, putative [Rhizoctonia solani AG-3 Rhs1AP]KEP55508.1 putative P-loop nucleoside triphosphate hydrolase [Rhizoctonia solani 123E]